MFTSFTITDFLNPYVFSPVFVCGLISPTYCCVCLQAAQPAGATGNGSAAVKNGGSIPGNTSQLPLVGGVDNRKNSNVLPIAVSSLLVICYHELSLVMGM